MNQNRIINKTMDKEDIKTYDAKVIVYELNSLIDRLRSKSLKISSWYGNFNLTGDPNSYEWINRGYDYKSLDNASDDINFPWFLYWEIIWIVLNNHFKAEHKVLDLGGSSSLFSYYLASKGVKIITVDIQKKLVDNANFVAKKMKWDLKNYHMDMRELNFKSKFDHITSICVFEHIPMFERVVINKRIKDFLVEGGKFSITFDYRNPDVKASINSPKDVYKQFIEPSGLKIRGNKDFYDNDINYLLHPFYYKRRLWRDKISHIKEGQFKPWQFLSIKNKNDYTFGALFLEK